MPQLSGSDMGHTDQLVAFNQSLNDTDVLGEIQAYMYNE